MQVADLCKEIDRLAPFGLAATWDNVGLIVGRRDAAVTRVLVALDARPAVIEKAHNDGCEAVITHHPVIFNPLTAITDAHGTHAQAILTAAEAGIAIIAAHTNLDAAHGGLNDLLAAELGLSTIEPLTPSIDDPEVGLGRVGGVEPTTVGEISRALGATLGLGPLQITGDPDRTVTRIACCTGSGASLIDQAIACHADAYVTGDLKYHDADHAGEMALVLAPHGRTEEHVLGKWFPVLANALQPQGVIAALYADTTDPWRLPDQH